MTRHREVGHPSPFLLPLRALGKVSAGTTAPLVAQAAGEDTSLYPRPCTHVPVTRWREKRDARGRRGTRAGGPARGCWAPVVAPSLRCRAHPSPAPPPPTSPPSQPSPPLSRAAPFSFLISQHISKATHCDGKKSPSSEIIARPPDVGVGCEMDLPPPPLARPPAPLKGCYVL